RRTSLRVRVRSSRLDGRAPRRNARTRASGLPEQRARSWQWYLAYLFDPRAGGDVRGKQHERRPGVSRLDGPGHTMTAVHARAQRATAPERAAEAFPGRDRDRALVRCV